MQTVNTFASECKLHAPIPNLLIQENVCSSFFREVRKRTAAQTTWADMGLGAPSSKEFYKHRIFMIRSLKAVKSPLSLSLYWYLSQGHEKSFPFRDDRLRMIFILERKIDPKRKKWRGKCVHVTKEIPRKGWDGRLSSNREVSAPCNLQGSTKTQPDSKPQGTGRDFPSLEMDWRWTDYDICKKRIPALRQKQISSGQTVFIYHRGQVSWFPNAWSLWQEWQCHGEFMNWVRHRNLGS